METIRTFIAIPLPEEIIAYLGEIINRLRFAAPEVKWVKPGSIHLTLKFLGNLPGEEVEKVFHGMEQVFRDPPAEFELTTGIVGAFPHFRRPRVLWIGLQGRGMKMLSQLQQQIEQQMVAEGFPAEDRAFSPHLTLGRIKFLKHEQDLRQAIRELELTDHTFPVKEVHVMRSDLKPSGAVYSVQKVFHLAPENKN